MLRDFISIDFETANQEPSSVCSVGVVMVRDGQSLPNHQLQTVAAACGYDLQNHHHALADAEACAAIALYII